MTGHFIRGRGHGHGHHHFHIRGLPSEAEQPSQLETGQGIGNSVLTGTNTIAQIVPRENNLDEKPVGGSMTLPIILGICIPVGLAVSVLLYLHYRTTVMQRKEDETDKYKSMDFGLDGNLAGKAGKRRSAFFGKEKDPSHKMQLSMDMNLSSPYLLPPNLQNSRESLAKSLNQAEDPYRPVTSYGASDAGSLRSVQKGPDRRSGPGQRPGQKGLPSSPSPLQPVPPAAKRSSRRESAEKQPPLPVKNEFRFVNDAPTVAKVPEIQEPAAAASRVSNGSVNAVGSATTMNSVAMPKSGGQGLGIMDARASQNSTDSSPNTNSFPAGARPPRNESLAAASNVTDDYEDYTAHFQIDDADDDVTASGDRPMPPRINEPEHPHSAGLGVPGKDNRRLSVGFRPLPPDDFLESEDPEFRANRIRSFYKEYFEETKTDSGKPPPIPQQAQKAAYYDDHDTNYLGDTAFFDPDSNAFVMPYAQPVTRRAMTPPPSNRRPMPGPGPRGPPGPHGPHGSMNMPGGPRGRPRAGSTQSAGRWAPMSPRPDSSASNRFAGNGAGGKPRKPMPPPAALNTLPTPSKLRDDSFAIMGSIDFAPPPSFKDIAAGRSQSPVGERKPYVLNTPIHSPLVSAFDDTPALPSPHLLRKSGTFTALDFAPPRRFKDPEAMSDSGSVVSNRSGISSANLSAIRGGAGRVSRLPGDTVFTQQAMGNTLKPSWNMRD
ncbi:hypothetical protein F5Y00DRAFT_58777 [Daldinia vernicosa]|uniref:uncharacterized protein n=1 Tax=Daldinia vernicosa TaxID=114800 RepID=UPI0020087654|nr:uncharacterized protein F5Y00DRAFT_58777 [Daldinia vernicosa]KAI0853724.1 hypothetical protein F5Y00DRAFT_58777 [Daldinia vernicosa]